MTTSGATGGEPGASDQPRIDLGGNSMKRTYNVLAAVAAVAVLGGLGGCGAGAGAVETKPAADERTDVTSGRPLEEFRGSPTYPFRVALHDNKDAVLAAMPGINAKWGTTREAEQDLRDFVSLCDDMVNGGVAGDALAERAVERFSGGTGTVTEEDGAELISLSKQYVCPADAAGSS